MGLGIAFKAFMKAWKEPQKGEEFLKETKTALPAPSDKGDYSHLRLLSLLQESGRLIDFLKEDLTEYTDAQVGAAVRKIHKDCSHLVEELVTIRPLMDEEEGAIIKIPQGYNPETIKVVGKVKGEPPFSGVLIHKGWKAHKRSLPKQIKDKGSEIISPAEVEVK